MADALRGAGGAVVNTVSVAGFGGGGSGAAGTVFVRDGHVIGVRMTAPGVGYGGMGAQVPVTR